VKTAGEVTEISRKSLRKRGVLLQSEATALLRRAWQQGVSGKGFSAGCSSP
jgi:hypothetical protein